MPEAHYSIVENTEWTDETIAQSRAKPRSVPESQFLFEYERATASAVDTIKHDAPAHSGRSALARPAARSALTFLGSPSTDHDPSTELEDTLPSSNTNQRASKPLFAINSAPSSRALDPFLPEAKGRLHPSLQAGVLRRIARPEIEVPFQLPLGASELSGLV